MTRREEGSLAVEAIEDSANLLDQTKQIWQRTLGDIAPLVVIGMVMGRRLGAGEAADPLAVALVGRDHGPTRAPRARCARGLCGLGDRVLYRGGHQVAVLDLDRGMRDEFDA